MVHRAAPKARALTGNCGIGSCYQTDDSGTGFLRDHGGGVCKLDYRYESSAFYGNEAEYG